MADDILVTPAHGTLFRSFGLKIQYKDIRLGLPFIDRSDHHPNMPYESYVIGKSDLKRFSQALSEFCEFIDEEVENNG